GPGYFYAPTVLRDVPSDARVLREEIFGPVAPIATFMSDDEALRAANDTEFGLVSYAYTRDLDRAFRVIEGLETGMVGLNRGLVSNPAGPFGGVKQSGFGREGGHEGINEYLEVRAALAQNGGGAKAHAAMALGWLRRRDPRLDEQLRKYLFTEGSMIAKEDEAAAGDDMDSGSLGIGSLRTEVTS